MVQRKKTRRKKYWLMLLLIVVMAGVVFGLLWYLNPKDSDGETVTDNKIEIRQEETEKTISVSNETDIEIDEIEKKVVQYEGGDPNEWEGLSGAITFAGISDGVLRVRLNIDQFLGGGTCELRILDGDNIIYVESAAIVGVAATSTCEGFDIGWDDMESGDFQIEVLIESGEKKGKVVGEVSL